MLRCRLRLRSSTARPRCQLPPPCLPPPPPWQVKAYDAHLTSSGGAISGAVTGVDVRVRSGGGGVTLKSLVGKRVEVDSGGGPVALGACYADSLELQSGRGCGWVAVARVGGWQLHGWVAVASGGGRGRAAPTL